jgi:hypothetical protein
MYQLYYCPNCRATIYFRDRFCGNCGISLKWIEAQTPSTNPTVPHHKLDEGQRNGYQQQQDRYHHKGQQKISGQYKLIHITQKPEHVNPQKHKNGHTDNNRVAIQEKKSPSNDTTEPLKNEVAKLLEKFREKVG